MSNERQDAVDYLQTAAIEVIKAMRSFLDIAEGLVREPETAATVGRAFAEAAAAAIRPDRATHDTDAEDEHDEHDEEHHTGVRRIDLSD